MQWINHKVRSLFQNYFLCHLLLVLIVYWEFLVQKKVFRFMDYGADSTLGETPLVIGLKWLIFQDGFPNWSFKLGAGAPLASQAMFFFDPFNWLLAPFPGQWVPFLIIYIHTLKVLLCLWFFDRYLRQRGYTRFSSSLGAMIFGFAGYSVLWGNFLPWSTGLVFTSLAMWGLERGLRQDRWLLFIASIFCFGLCSIYFLYMFSIYLALYTIAWPWDEYRKLTFDFCQRVLKSVLAYGLGLGIAGYFLVPTVKTLLQSARVGRESVPLFSTFDVYYNVSLIGRFFSNTITYGTCADYGTANYYPKWNSNHYNMPAVYCGMLFLLLIPQVLQWKSLRDRRGMIGLGALLVIAFFSPFLSSALHGFSYVSARWAFVFVAFAAWFVADSINGFEKEKRTLNAPILYGTLFFQSFLLIAVLSAGSGIYGCETRSLTILASRNWHLFAFLAMNAWLLLKAFGKYSQHQWRLVLLLGVLLELGLLGRLDTVERNVASAEMFHPGGKFYDGTLEAVEFIKKKDPSFYRIMKSYYNSGYNDPVYLNYNGVTNYCSSMPPGQSALHSTVWGAEGKGMFSMLVIPPDRAAALNLLAVKYYLSKGPASDPYGAVVPTGFRKTDKKGSISIYENRYFNPGGLLYDSYLVAQDLEGLTPKQRTGALLSSLLFDGDAKDIPGITLSAPSSIPLRRRLQSTLKRHTEFRMISDTHLETSFTTQKPKVLVASIIHDPDWQAVLNGSPAKVFPANSGFLGIWVPPGKHHVVFKYIGRANKYGAILSLLSIFIVALALLLKRRKRSVALVT
jgi:uncharacterized membrane protein YfhO